MSDYIYDINPTTNPLTRNELYVGRTVCFADVHSNPNNIGVLEQGNSAGHGGFWKATINNILYTFDINGKCLEDNSLVLYGIVTSVDLDLTESSAITRGSGADESTTTLSSVIPKDQFAMSIIGALLNTVPNALALDDAAILALAIKSYKIAQAMLYIGTSVRGADHQSEQSTDPVPVDEANLTDNVEKILFNINSSVKALKDQISTKVSVDNPDANTKLKVEGTGGGGGSINYNDLTSMYASGNNAVQDVVGFCSDTSNNKILGKITLQNFANALKSFIDSFIDNRGLTDIAVDGAWYQTLVTLIDGRITTKVKSEALNP